MTWATQAQKDHAGKLMVFTWKGYPRWPGIVLPAHKRKRKILEGSTVFVKPEPNIFEGTHIVATRMGLDKGDVCKVKTTQKTLDLQPASEKCGIHYKEDGFVKSVGEGSQCKRLGVKAGWKMLKLNDMKFSKDRFRKFRQGLERYTVTFDTSQVVDDEWEAATIVSYSDGKYSVRLCSSGKLRKGFTRNDIVAPEDADRITAQRCSHGGLAEACSGEDQNR